MTMLAFYENPTIRRLSSKPKWTVSSKDKVPLDMFEFSVKRNCCGAVFDVEGTTMTLPDVDEVFASHGVPSNHTFYLDVLEDDVVVLDVEPTCPKEIKERFLKFPYIYGETSMSGNGLHLVFPKPRNFEEFQTARKKVALKGENKHYEVLLNHWVTFTGNVLDPVVSPNAEDQSEFESFYERLAKTQVETQVETPFDMGDIDLAEIPHADRILEVLIHSNPFRGRFENYGNDMSRWEMGWVRFKYERMLIAMHVDAINPDGHMYTLQERAAILHEVCKQAMPHRSKHDTWRTSHFNSWHEQLVYKVIATNTKKDDPAYVENLRERDENG